MTHAKSYTHDALDLESVLEIITARINTLADFTLTHASTPGGKDSQAKHETLVEIRDEIETLAHEVSVNDPSWRTEQAHV